MDARGIGPAPWNSRPRCSHLPRPGDQLRLRQSTHAQARSFSPEPGPVPAGGQNRSRMLVLMPAGFGFGALLGRYTSTRAAPS